MAAAGQWLAGSTFPDVDALEKATLVLERKLPAPGTGVIDPPQSRRRPVGVAVRSPSRHLGRSCPPVRQYHEGIRKRALVRLASPN